MILQIMMILQISGYHLHNISSPILINYINKYHITSNCYNFEGQLTNNKQNGFLINIELDAFI